MPEPLAALNVLGRSQNSDLEMCGLDGCLMPASEPSVGDAPVQLSLFSERPSTTATITDESPASS